MELLYLCSWHLLHCLRRLTERLNAPTSVSGRTHTRPFHYNCIVTGGKSVFGIVSAVDSPGKVTVPPPTHPPSLPPVQGTVQGAGRQGCIRREGTSKAVPNAGRVG